MRKWIFILILLFAAGCLTQQPKQACFRGECFDLELARTAEQRNQGLMFRKELAPDKGMLFMFETEGRHCFWMKNTYISLDIIWLNQNKEVVDIKKDAQPCKSDPCAKFCPDKNGSYILEVNAGTCQRLGLRVGDVLFLD